MGPPYQPFEQRDAVIAWERRAGVRAALLAEATTRMLDSARLGLGSQVLDVGTGTGDTALLAAERVGPAGHVLAIDASPEMVEQAVGKVRRSGLENVDVQVMDGARLSLADISRDAVIGRNAMQFLPGWPLPLMGFHRVLRQGGRLAFIVWGPPEENPYFHLPVSLAREHGWMRAPREALETPYRLADGDRLHADLTTAGFREAAVARVAVDVHMPEAAPLASYIRESPMFHANADQLNAEERVAFDATLVAAIERFREGDGYRIPVISLLVTGTRS